MTPEAIARWCVGPIHPEGYEMIVTQYEPKYGHFLTMPIGYQKVADSVLTPAMDKIWTGEANAATAMKLLHAGVEVAAVLKGSELVRLGWSRIGRMWGQWECAVEGRNAF